MGGMGYNPSLYRGDTPICEGEILSRLYAEQVFSVRVVDGKARLIDGCDECFYVDLTADEVRRLAAELTAIADAMK